MKYQKSHNKIMRMIKKWLKKYIYISRKKLKTYWYSMMNYNSIIMKYQKYEIFKTIQQIKQLDLEQ